MNHLGDTMNLLSDALFTTTQQRVLGLLYGQVDRSFYTNEILRLTGMGVATIKRELDRMTIAGLLTLRKQGNQIHYQANPECPVFQELQSIVRKTFGLADILKQALNPIADRIRLSFVFGSVASGKESATSDIDILLVGEISFSEAVAALYPTQAILMREINPKVYRPKEWQALLKEKNAFIKELMEKPRLELIGQGNEPEESDWNQPGND